MSHSAPIRPLPFQIVMLGATGAVGGHVVRTLQTTPQVEKLTLLNRRDVPALAGTNTTQYAVDVMHADSYAPHLVGHNAAVCTLGVGQPSKISKEEFVRVDRDAVIAFATACKDAGVAHFSILSSVGADAKSRSLYLRTKGELNEALTALKFERLSVFQPSMILTPSNRYGLSQAVLLKVWPLLDPIFLGRFKKFRGIDVGALGTAIAHNVLRTGSGSETLQWPEIQALASAMG
jgi:uncharacterized protein YbjT (DUF2867 family)